jgi:hypothetical protein
MVQGMRVFAHLGRLYCSARGILAENAIGLSGNLTKADFMVHELRKVA